MFCFLFDGYDYLSLVLNQQLITVFFHNLILYSFDNIIIIINSENKFRPFFSLVSFGGHVLNCMLGVSKQESHFLIEKMIDLLS
jgi:hypothetical protein